MKHSDPRWNPSTRQWFCAVCGRASERASVKDAQIELEQFECRVPAVEAPRAEPGTETVRLIKKPYKMNLKKERGGSRFTLGTDEGRPFIQLELLHENRVEYLNALSIGFELLNDVTLEQARTLIDAMNEKIAGVIVIPK